MTLLELAERCEAATGIEASSFFWNLEREIKAALEGREYISFEDDLANRRGATPPRYCTSLDAAMTLVPEGHFWTGGTHAEYGSGMAVHHNRRDDMYAGKAATPALALCAASLRAISAGGENA